MHNFLVTMIVLFTKMKILHELYEPLDVDECSWFIKCCKVPFARFVHVVLNWLIFVSIALYLEINPWTWKYCSFILSFPDKDNCIILQKSPNCPVYHCSQRAVLTWITCQLGPHNIDRFDLTQYSSEIYSDINRVQLKYHTKWIYVCDKHIISPYSERVWRHRRRVIPPLSGRIPPSR